MKSDDFFSAAKYLHIKFSNGQLKKSGSDFKLSGDLTIKDITKSIVLDVEYGGSIIDGYG